MDNQKPISPRRDPRTVADMLLKEHGVEKALKRIASEKASARRARSRQRFQFWNAISEALAVSERVASSGPEIYKPRGWLDPGRPAANK